MNSDEKKDLKIRTASSCKVLNGTKTDILCSNFEDRLFILVTQYGKFGSWYHIERESLPWDSEEASEEIPLNTELLFGTDNPIFYIFAKYIARAIYKSSSIEKPILLSIAMKDESRENLPLTADFVLENCVW